MNLAELVAGAVAGVVIGEPLKAVGQHLYRGRYGTRRAMTYRFLAYDTVSACLNEPNFELDRYAPAGDPLAKLLLVRRGYVASITFQSISTDTLRAEDFVRPIVCDFDRGLKIISAEVIDGRPSGYHDIHSLALHVDGNQVTMRPRAVRPYHYFTVMFVLDGPLISFDISCKIDGQTKSMYELRRAQPKTPLYVREPVYYRRGL